MKIATALAVALGTATLSTAAGAATLNVSITNTAPSNGFAITPLFSAFHDGSFDPVELGEPASTGLERIAELGGVTQPLAEELKAASPGAALTVLKTALPVPQIEPGETATNSIRVDDGLNRFFTYAAMLVPSNDTFLANDDPLALFGTDGEFLGDRTIEVAGIDLFEANTEINDPDFGPAFVAGEDITEGAIEGGVIGRAEPLPAFADVLTQGGYRLAESAIDFGSDPSAFSVARIEITEVAPIPLPAAGLMLAGALGLLGAGRSLRRRG